MDTKISIVERFQEWLQEEGKATKTIESYITDVKLFQQYFNIVHRVYKQF